MKIKRALTLLLVLMLTLNLCMQSVLAFEGTQTEIPVISDLTNPGAVSASENLQKAPLQSGETPAEDPTPGSSLESPSPSEEALLFEPTPSAEIPVEEPTPSPETSSSEPSPTAEPTPIETEPTETPAASPTLTPAADAMPTAKIEPSATPEVSPSSAPSPSISPSAAPSVSPSASPSPAVSPSSSPTASPTPTPTPLTAYSPKALLGDAIFNAVVTGPLGGTAARGETISVDVVLPSTLSNCGGFTLDLSYDNSKLSLSQISSPLKTGNNEVFFNPSDDMPPDDEYKLTDKVRILYLTGSIGNPAPLSGTVLSVSFTVKSNAGFGPVSFDVDVTDVCDANAQSITTGTGAGCTAYVVPATPAITGTNTSFDDFSINLAWTGSPDAQGYCVFRGTDPSSLGHIGNSATTSFSDANVASGVTYYYSACAYFYLPSGECMYSDWSNVASNSISLATPTLSATSGTDGITLSWNTVQSAMGYCIFRRTDASQFTHIGNAASPNYKDSNISLGVTYYYTVCAYRTIPSGEFLYGGFSNNVSGSFYLETPTLTAVSGVDGIILSWNTVPNATGYCIFRRTDASDFTFMGNAASPDYTDSNISLGVTYYYTICTYRNLPSGECLYSGFSNNVSGSFYLETPTLTATSSAEGITLSWNTVSNATGYCIFRRTDASSFTFMGNAASSDYTDSNISLGVTYYYTVCAYRTMPSGEFLYGGFSNNVSGSFYLETPTLTSTSGIDGITLSWNTVPDATGYCIFRRTDSSQFTHIGNAASPDYTDSNIALGVTYYYTVCTYRNTASGGCLYSGFSNNVSGSFYLETPTLTATSGVDGITLSWNVIQGATGYCIFRRTDAGSFVFMGNAASPDYTDSNISLGVTYHYTICTYRNLPSGECLYSGFSNNVSGSFYLGTPTLTATSGVDGITLSWNTTQNATGYCIFRRTDASDFTFMGNAASPDYTDGNISLGTTYHYTICAYYNMPSGECLYSGFSNNVSGSFYLETPTLTASSSVDGITLTWNAIQGATGYCIFRRTDASQFTHIGNAASSGYTDSNISLGVTYHYTICAYYNMPSGECLYSGFSNNVSGSFYLGTPTLTAASGVSGMRNPMTFGRRIR